MRRGLRGRSRTGMRRWIRTGAEPAGEFQRELGLLDAIAIVAGSMIGSGIFIVSADIARIVQAPGWLLLVWLLAGLMTVIGALAYGELAAMLPKAGGPYVYLREAYSPLLGFLYGWTLFLVIQTGTIAAVAVAFAKFLGVWLPDVSAERFLVWLASGSLSVSTQQGTAIGVVLLLTWINAQGLREGRLIQNIFTVAKVGALGGLILAGLTHPTPEALAANLRQVWGPETATPAFVMALGGAMVGALFSFDAWTNVTFLAGEVRKPARTLPQSLMLGTGLVLLLYALVNAAYLAVLPLEGTAEGVGILARGIQHAQDDRVATAVAQVLFGPAGAALVAGLILISTFGCLNGLILAGPRLYYAMAQDGLFFPGAGRLNAAGVPGGGLWLQAGWAAVLILSGTYSQLLDYVIFAALLFYALTVGALFVLRITRPGWPRPYRALGYPWLPALYLVGATALLVDLLLVKPGFTWPGLVLVLLGIPVYRFWQCRASVARAGERPVAGP